MFFQREKKRVLYLYNETLKQRKGFYKYMKKKVRRIMRENKLTVSFNYNQKYIIRKN